MKVALGSDHRGYRYKEIIKNWLKQNGYEVFDCGTNTEESCDYPDFGFPTSKAVAEGQCERALLFCSTGNGMVITANKVKGIRAALGLSPEHTKMSRLHNDANVLAIPADYIDETTMLQMVELWLKTPFESERHARRVAKIEDFEERFCNPKSYEPMDIH
ncbi:MAG: ribose 5-phosphate isomerase B [Candidatus Edwardsbacteria bacterium]